ncbi:uncharacterized protein B0I36DRAFT_3200 [Microdochium trichocladiopsis]|uniref:Zn(2)-C6 fungal-type domain-containing protein n=1 Tax=Microdochium trichocladiopsis TaxID=1682393 RepID=A0A9P9BVM4_9PEZI|nr:uncharacterized protein B0I36DRAFT_3200 [Microdochium trichocladiopsis]KAH7039897.1 hypothetical protein B0I36DRAFT_3200 [Microdochium trichocladiopsis]
MPKSPTSARLHPRQRPVSCRFCRTRKLRCSREAPCSNCVSRDIHCDLVQPAPQPVAADCTPSCHATSSTEARLLERIQILEQQLSDCKTTISKGKLDATITPVVTTAAAAAHFSTPESLDEVSQAPWPPPAAATLDNLDSDEAWLETLYSGQECAVPRPLDRISFRMCPLGHIGTADSSGHPGPRRVHFPTPAEADVLVERYIQHINHIHHTIHVPSLRNVVRSVYACLERQATIQPGPAALVLAVLASGAYCFNIAEDICTVGFHDPQSARQQAMSWVRDVEDIIDIAHRVTKVSIEGCQALIVAFFVLADTEGLSLRCRSNVNLAMLLARQLGLHQIDGVDAGKCKDPVLEETGRCVWWYIVATDWIMSQRLTGVDRNVYLCNPRHMAVKKPMNIDDDDLATRGPAAAKSLSWPTCKAYTLQRIRLAEITRKISDRAAIIGNDLQEAAYEAVLELDLEMQQMLDELPAYFRQAVPALMETYNLDRTQASKLRQQGHLIYNHIISQRAALHFPWFLRANKDKRYAPSRDICLLCARQTVLMEAEVEVAGLSATAQYKFVCVLMALFRAAVVLVVQFCRSKTSDGSSSRARLRQEIMEALTILETAKEHSETACRSFESLCAVMRKHRISARDTRVDASINDKTLGACDPDMTQTEDYRRCPTPKVARGRTLEGTDSSTTIFHGAFNSEPTTTALDGTDATEASTYRHDVNVDASDIFGDAGTSIPASFEIDFPPDSFSYQLNKFAESLEADPMGLAELTWSNVFAGWGGA